MSDITENLVIEDDILFITTGKYKLFLYHGKIGMDAFLLYMHYMFTCRLQQTNSVWANDVYVRQGLNWTRPKLQKAKNLLLDLELISTKRTRNANGTLGKTYVIIKTKTNMLEFKENDHVHDNQQMDKPTDGNRTSNALTKKEMLKQESKCLKNSEKDEILSIWNGYKEKYNKCIIHHSINPLKQQQIKAVNNYTKEQFSKAINKYCEAFTNDKYWWSYSYANINKFIDKLDYWVQTDLDQFKIVDPKEARKPTTELNILNK